MGGCCSVSIVSQPDELFGQRSKEGILADLQFFVSGFQFQFVSSLHLLYSFSKLCLSDLSLNPPFYLLSLFSCFLSPSVYLSGGSYLKTAEGLDRCLDHCLDCCLDHRLHINFTPSNRQLTQEAQQLVLSFHSFILHPFSTSSLSSSSSSSSIIIIFIIIIIIIKWSICHSQNS